MPATVLRQRGSLVPLVASAGAATAAAAATASRTHWCPQHFLCHTTNSILTHTTALAGGPDPLAMVAASIIWAVALQQLDKLPATPQHTSTSRVAAAEAEFLAVVPLPAIALLQELSSNSPAEWNRVVADLKVGEQHSAAWVLWHATY